MLLPLKPICEAKKARRDGTSVIYIQYCYSSEKRTNLNTELAIPAEYWNDQKLFIKPDLPPQFGEAARLNEEIKRMYRLAEDLISLADKKKVENKGRFVKEVFKPDLDINILTAEEAKLKGLASPAKEKINTDVYFQLAEYIKCKTGMVCESTLSIFRNLGEQLKDFEVFRNEPVTFEGIDFDFYDRFAKFLTFDYVQKRRKQEIKGLKQNSVRKAVVQLRRFVNDRADRNIISNVEKRKFTCPEEEADAIYLTYPEISKIYDLDLSAFPYLIPYRNRFVVACLTALRFSDFSIIKPQDIRGGKLYKKQEKSEKWVVIPLRKEAKELLKEIFNETNTYITNPDFNANIKIIGKLAGINELITFSYKKGGENVKETRAKCDWITSHTGRRSFCTNEFLAGTPVSLIMKISGHKKEKDFFRYIRISPEEAAEVIKRLWEEKNGMQVFANLRKRISA